ncbi:helix-turn-helix transcriptional regulator [Paenibacillus sp. FSL F4-0122]|uniref:helix-turn-helix domain-containing protein n=1 Tax=Paenibacillus sp. FSL F4-0122 TaxID=2921371 RepID=UPI0030F55A52
MSFPVIHELGKRVRKYRKDKKWSQEELADQANFGSVSSISNLENGKWEQGPSYIALIGLANAFGISISELVGEKDGYIASIGEELDSFREVIYDPLELTYNLSDNLHTIGGVELKDGEAKQIIDFGHFLILRRNDVAGKLLKELTNIVKQAEGKYES